MSIIRASSIFDKETQLVQDFYNENPFPGYEDSDTKHSILLKGNKNILANKLKNIFKYKNKILEVGSGTCQLANYFAISTNNQVTAFDATLKSLELGYNFAKKNNIENINFVHGNILKEVFKEEYFDFVWCNGVLHHTTDPYLGFQNCVKTLKKNGLILVGLYNFYGRFFTKIKQILFKIFGVQLIKMLDPFIFNHLKKDQQINAWIQDQYNHPLEKTYTFKTLYSWFKKNNISLISSVPQATPLKLEDLKESDLKKKLNFKLDHMYFFIELKMLLNFYGQDGGLFIFLGQKN